MGYPLASGFAMVTMSGWQSTGHEECAHSVPLLYSPHYAHLLLVKFRYPTQGMLVSEQEIYLTALLGGLADANNVIGASSLSFPHNSVPIFSEMKRSLSLT